MRRVRENRQSGSHMGARDGAVHFAFVGPHLERRRDFSEGAPALRNLRIEAEGGPLTQPGGESAARLADGRRVAALRTAPPASVDIVDDFSGFAAGFGLRARSSDPAFGTGPFRRRAVLTSILSALEYGHD